MILPSKKVLSILVLTSAFIATVMIVFGGEKSSSAINFASGLTAGEKLQLPQNPSWKDELGQIALSNIPVQEAEETKQTTTDIVSTTIASNYLALKQSGTLDQQSAQKLIDQTIDFISQDVGTMVTVSQLNVIPDNGIQTITEYGDNLGTILRSNRPTVVKNEVEIITKALELKDQSKIEELQSIANVYNKITSDLIKMKVPKTFVKAHLDMVNGSRGMGMALKEIQSVLGDPVKGLSSLQVYGDSASILTQSLIATKNFIIKNKVVYKQGTGGYYLLYGI